MEILRTININGTRAKGDESSRIREFCISNERVDGHKSVIPLDLWDLTDFNKAGAFYYQHQTGSDWWSDPNVNNALGPATAEIRGNELVGIANFEPVDINPLADTILKKVDWGTMKCTSVGFMPIKSPRWGDENRGEDPTVLYFQGQVLKEFSIVHIPSNPDAIKKAMEPYNNYLLTQLDGHKSEGFRKDMKRQLLRNQFEFIL